MATLRVFALRLGRMANGWAISSPPFADKSNNHGMKKFLIGCFAVVAVLAIAGTVGAYYFLWRPAQAYVKEFAKLKEIPQLNQQVRKTESFTPPSNGLLKTNDVDRFLRTQQAMQVKLGQRLDEFTAKYRMLSQTADYKPSVSELMSAYKDLAGLIIEAKRAQVDALNQNNYSLAEYDWTRRSVYEASAIPLNLDFEKVLRSVSEGNKPGKEKRDTSEPAAPVVVPQQNRELVAPHTKVLADRAALAAFGL